MGKSRNTVSLSYTCPVTVVVDMDSATVEVILVTLTGMRLDRRHEGIRRAQRAAEIVFGAFRAGTDPPPIIA